MKAHLLRLIEKHFPCVGPNVCPLEGPGRHIKGCPVLARSRAASLVRDLTAKLDSVESRTRRAQTTMRKERVEDGKRRVSRLRPH